ncbi:MAG: DapH/DapD/GlmU-related protein [Desulfatirhabdiaceae bacterium]
MTVQKPETDFIKTPLIDQLHHGRQSVMQRYRNKAVGDISLAQFVRYEMVSMLAANMGGGVGYLLRRWGYGPLFRAVGKGVILGKGIAVRHPNRIFIGSQVSIDDDVLLDAAGADIRLGDRCIISRNCVIQGKTGSIDIGDRADIGCDTILTSVNGIFLEASVLIAGHCYIGGARYHMNNPRLPIMDQGTFTRGKITIGEGSWLGAGVIVLDGVSIGRGCVIGAGAVVTGNLPDYCVAAGVPARIIRGAVSGDMA